MSRKGQEDTWYISTDDDGEEVHTASNPYCGKWPCWCHDDAKYHDQVTAINLSDEPSEKDKEHVRSFFGLRW